MIMTGLDTIYSFLVTTLRSDRSPEKRPQGMTQDVISYFNSVTGIIVIITLAGLGFYIPDSRLSGSGY